MTMAPTGQASATSLQRTTSLTSERTARARMSGPITNRSHLVQATQPMHASLSTRT